MGGGVSEAAAPLLPLFLLHCFVLHLGVQEKCSGMDAVVTNKVGFINTTLPSQLSNKGFFLTARDH